MIHKSKYHVKNYLVPTNIIVSLDPCKSHKSQLVIYCFQSLANFPLALSFSQKTAAKAFLVRTRGLKGQVEFRQNTLWELSIFALWVREPPQFFIFSLLWTFTCSRTWCATKRVRGVAGILFTMASRQTATIATSCSIWPHQILAFSTSAFPSFYSSHIPAHFQVFTMQRHAIDCFVRRHGYVSNTSGQWFPLSVNREFTQIPVNREFTQPTTTTATRTSQICIFDSEKQ